MEGVEEVAWPEELKGLVTIPQVAACLEALDVHSLSDFADCIDVEEGHDEQLRAVVDALPSKPRRNKLLRNRAKLTLTDLLQRLSVFVEYDTDEDGFLSRVECMRLPPEKMQARAGGTVADHFDAIDTDRDGRITFTELFAAAELAGAEAVPPSSMPRIPAPAPIQQPAGVQLWVKAPDGAALRVVANSGLATTVAEVRSLAADAAHLDVSHCRLIFAGRELEDRMLLADYSCDNTSELHLVLRVEEADTCVDREAEEQTAAMRNAMVGKKLADFNISKKIGGKDITAVGGGASQSVSQSGVCSYVYLGQLRGLRVQFAVKVMLNYQEGRANTVAIQEEFDAETALLSDPNRFPAHRHVMVVLHSFTDNAAALPSWNFEADIVNPHTMFVVMPFFPTDLKRVFKTVQRQNGQEFGELRAVRIVSHLLLAVRHLKSHGIVHRDVKLDNVMIARPGTEDEAAVLTDFGMCLDLTKNRISNFRVPMPYDGIRRGGAPIALAPEVTLPKPGPDVFLDYSKNDEWAVGMVAHQLLSQDSAGPFVDMEHPATYSDAGYQEETIPQSSRPLVAGLLRVVMTDRLDATDASRRAKRLEETLREKHAVEEAARSRLAEEEAASLALARRLQEEEDAAARAQGSDSEPQSELAGEDRRPEHAAYGANRRFEVGDRVVASANGDPAPTDGKGLYGVGIIERIGENRFWHYIDFSGGGMGWRTLSRRAEEMAFAPPVAGTAAGSSESELERAPVEIPEGAPPNAYCRITDAGVEEVNGYYVWDQDSHMPRFDNVSNSSEVAISFGMHWTIYGRGGDMSWFYEACGSTQADGPPAEGWEVHSDCPKPDATVPKLVLLRTAGDFGPGHQVVVAEVEDDSSTSSGISLFSSLGSADSVFSDEERSDRVPPEAPRAITLTNFKDSTGTVVDSLTLECTGVYDQKAWYKDTAGAYELYITDSFGWVIEHQGLFLYKNEQNDAFRGLSPPTSGWEVANGQTPVPRVKHH